MSNWRPLGVFDRQPVRYSKDDNAAAVALLAAYRAKPSYPKSTPQHSGGAIAQLNKEGSGSRKERAWLESVETLIQEYFPDFVIRIYIFDPQSDFCPYEGLHLYDKSTHADGVTGGAIGEFLGVLQRGKANDLICLLNKYSGASAQKGKPHHYSDMAERLTREFANMMERAADIEPAAQAVVAAQAAAAEAAAAQAAADATEADAPLDEEDDWMALADDRPDILLQAKAARVAAEEALERAKKIYLAAQERYAETQSAFTERVKSITSGGGKRSRTSAEKSQDVREISALLSDDVKAYMRTVIDPAYVMYVM